MIDMRPYYETDGIAIYYGDCRDVLPSLAAESVDLVLTDPPYPAEFAWCWDVLAAGSYRALKDRRHLISLLGHYQGLTASSPGDQCHGGGALL